MLLIKHPTCSTCIKAEKYLLDRGFSFETRNIITENPTFEELKKWHESYGIEVSKMINTSGMLYRQQNLKEKMLNMSDEDKLKILSSNGMLVKRPILVLKDRVLFGFRIKEREEV